MSDPTEAIRYRLARNRATRGTLEESVALLPTPVADNSRGLSSGGDYASLPNVILLPTPVVNDMGARKSVDEWDSWADDMRERHGNGNGHGAALSVEVLRMLPTPTARDFKDGRASDAPENALLGRVVWQPLNRYAAAIAAWERMTRPAPVAVVENRLNPAFVEWMMGLPDGWVTGVAGVSRTAALKILGNGVVPQQARLALDILSKANS